MSTGVHAEIEDHLTGYARVKLNDVEFDTGRDLDDRNVKRLINIFKLQGCRREDPANAIPIVVGKELLAEVLARHGLHALTLRSFVPAQLPCITAKVICLHGKHRICASREFLEGSDQWWTVKVFDSSRRFLCFSVSTR